MSLDVRQNASNPSDGAITIRAEYQGRNMDDDYYETLLQNCRCTFRSLEPSGQQDPVQIENLQYDRKNSRTLRGSFHAPTPGRYRVEFLSSSGEEYPPKSAEIDMRPPLQKELYIKRVPRPLTVKQVTIPGWEEISLKIVKIDYPGFVLVEEDDTSFTLTSLETGSGFLTVTVESVSEGTMGQQWEIVYPIGVTVHAIDDSPEISQDVSTSNQSSSTSDSNDESSP